jgi:hypothetical protein
MPVYPLAARSASCASPGCRCHDRRPVYPSDTTDEQWQVLRPEAGAVMAELVQVSGRPMVHDRRAMMDAVFTWSRTGSSCGCRKPMPPGDIHESRLRRGHAAGPGNGLGR